MDWQLLHIVLSLVVSFMASWLAYLGWRRRDALAAEGFIALTALVAGLSLIYSLEAASSDLATFVFWSKVEYVVVVAIPVAWLVFALQFTGYGHWVIRKTLLVLSIVPALTVLFVWTNEWHHLIWTEVRLDRSGVLPAFTPGYGAWFWVHVAYSYTLLLWGSVLLVRRAIRTWQLYRNQSIALLVSVLPPWLGSAFMITDFELVPEFNPVPISFLVAGAVLGWAVLRLHVFEIMPIAAERVLQSIPDAVIVLNLDSHILSMNPAADRYIEGSLDETIGRRVQNVFHRSDGDFASVLDGLAEEETRREIEWDDEHVEITVLPLYDRSGRLQGWLLLIRDITARKHAENELGQRVDQLTIMRQVNDEISSTLNIDHVLSVALDAALRLSGADAGFIALAEEGNNKYHLRIAQVVGQYPQDEAALILKPDEGIVGRAIRNKQSELVLDVTADEDYQPILPNTKAQMVIPLLSQEKLVSVINLETARPERFSEEVFQFLQILASRIAVALDNARLYQDVQVHLSEVQQLYEQVSELEQLKTDMIRIAAHDLRSPLSAISGYLQLIDFERDNIDQDYHAYFDDMRQAADQMTRMIAEFLSLERIEQMAKAETGEVFDLREQVQSAYGVLNDQAQRKLQRMTLDVDSEQAVFVRGDASQVYEAVANLITNAVKYTPEEGRIEVRLRQEGDCAVLEVIDTGYGIPEDQQARLFQPFYRVETAQTRKIEGLGLGLHLVKNIVERHDGRMIFKSKHGEGSTFGFELPLVAVD